jgi:SAM-dependent methyltransferase
MWDERFAEPGFAYGTEANVFLRERVADFPPGRVLSLAEGEGRNAVYLAERGFAVTAVDASRVGLEKAARLARERGVAFETVVADLAEYAFPTATFTGVIAVFCHLPPALRRTVHRRAAEALLPGGVFLIEAYRPEQLALGTGGPKTRELLFTREDLLEDLSGLELLHVEETERELREGAYHNGRSALIEVLARKR